MPNRTLRRWGLLAGISLLASFGNAQAAGVVVEKTLNVDLSPLIDVAVKKRERFAVDLPLAASTAHAGSWQRAGGNSVWTYSVRVPTAVSLSFHATRFKLPAGASLTVTSAAGTHAIYSAADGSAGELWSRIQLGDTLRFELRVATSQEADVDLAFASLQAGYRVLGGGAPDHPHYQQLKKAQAIAEATTCIENFSCHATPGNQGNADATAAIVIRGIALCTATLINNLRNDGAPYLLSARHCQEGPGSAVVVYWDAAVPCGTALGSVYDTQTPAYVNGSDTVFEQQDVWMLRLSSPINANRVYFAGWDATGGVFVGGYGAHHALGRSRQYVHWFGQSYPYTLTRDVLGVGYDSNYWGVVNDVGAVGSGASGGGLFTEEHRLVGVASLAVLTNGANSDGVCPVASPPAPAASTSTALYASLAAVWESNADTTSFTNPVTLKSLLDPDNTGAKVSGGFEPLPGVIFSVNQSYASTGSPVTLSWNGGTATSCTATGGAAGDGWSGTLPASGTRDVVEYSAGDTNYTLRCVSGTRSSTRQVRVSWQKLPPQVNLYITSASDTGQSVLLSWNSNVVPCTATGGVASDGWAGAKTPRGTQTVSAGPVGTHTYTLSCGSGADAVSQSAQFTVDPPTVSLVADANNMRVGQTVLFQQTGSGSCTRTGGFSGDGWAGPFDAYPIRVTATTAGTYRYTLTCVSGGQTAATHVDLTFTNNPPTATLSANPGSSEVVPAGPIQDTVGPPPNAIGLTWVSNVQPCLVRFDGPDTNDGFVTPGERGGADTVYDLQNVPGTYIYTVNCGSGSVTASATTTAQWLPQSPKVELVVLDTTVVANEAFFLGWNSSIGPCVAVGGETGSGWAGAKSTISGSSQVTLFTPGAHVLEINCGSGTSVVHAAITLTVPARSLVLAPHVSTERVGTPVAISWTSTTAPCVVTGVGSMLPAVGSTAVSSSTVGTVTYTVSCGTGTIVSQSTQITWRPLPTADITASSAELSVNQPVTLQWQSSNADHCVVFGPDIPDWAGDVGTSGTRVISRSVPTSNIFGINCDGAVDIAGVNWLPVTVGNDPSLAPTVNLTIDHTSRKTGEAVSIEWTTVRAAGCRGDLGASGDQWAGPLPVSGSRSIQVNVAGTYTWTIVCEGAPPSATASVTATFTAPAPPPPSGGGSGSSSSSSGGGGGGGRIDPKMLALLGAVLLFSRTAGRRRQLRQRTGSGRGGGLSDA